MTIAGFSIKRPTLITSIIIMIVTVGFISMGRLGLDLYPDISVPVVSITTTYAGSTPVEIENLITKPIEDSVRAIAGIKRISSKSLEGTSVIVIEFNLGQDIKDMNQQVREKVAAIRNDLPADTDEPLIQRRDPSDIPIMKFALIADVGPAKMYDYANEVIKPLLTQINNVSDVMLVGATRREIQVELDRRLINATNIPAVAVVQQLKNSGENIPVGKFDKQDKELSYRAVGRFESLQQISESLISFSGDYGNAVTLNNLGQVRDYTEDRKSVSTIYFTDNSELKGNSTERRISRPCILLEVYKQSGSNTVRVTNAVTEQLGKINQSISHLEGKPRLVEVYNGSRWIKANVEEVGTSILLGILLAVFVVYLFLGNARSTIITAIAIPTSLLGAFIIMYIMNFTFNLISLIALSLSVGLLVDDAIVVQENIHKKVEAGMTVWEAARAGTDEIAIAVIATTLTIIAVFMPIGFLQGVVGRFFFQFGMTVVFAMAISLFVSLTVVPFLNAYSKNHEAEKGNRLVRLFSKLQDYLDALYGKAMNVCLNHPLWVIAVTIIIFAASIGAFGMVKKTFTPEGASGEIQISLETIPGTSIQGTAEAIKDIEEKIKTIPDLDHVVTIVGNDRSESNKATIDVYLVSYDKRSGSPEAFKQKAREVLKHYPELKPSVAEIVPGKSETYPFDLIIRGNDLNSLQAYSDEFARKIKRSKDLTEVDTSMKKGKPEYQIVFDYPKMNKLGISQKTAAAELRYHVAGGKVGKFHENDLEYDVRLRFRPDQRDIHRTFNETRVPNAFSNLVPLTAVAHLNQNITPSQILRENSSRAVEIVAGLAEGGAVGNAMADAEKIMKTELPLPPGMSYEFVGDSSYFSEMVGSIIIAMTLAILFIYLALASLYESFVTPLIILVAIPPAMTGAFITLLVSGKIVDVLTMIGLVMLMGLVTKNSILLVDFALVGVRSGMSRRDAIFNAGMKRLRPILMTTFAMMAGMLPLALGIGEAARMRQAMGIAILGGVGVSTLITIFVVPAIFEYVDRLRETTEFRFKDNKKTIIQEKNFPATRTTIVKKSRKTDS